MHRMAIVQNTHKSTRQNKTNKNLRSPSAKWPEFVAFHTFVQLAIFPQDLVLRWKWARPHGRRRRIENCYSLKYLFGAVIECNILDRNTRKANNAEQNLVGKSLYSVFFSLSVCKFIIRLMTDAVVVWQKVLGLFRYEIDTARVRVWWMYWVRVNPFKLLKNPYPTYTTENLTFINYSERLTLGCFRFMFSS